MPRSFLAASTQQLVATTSPINGTPPLSVSAWVRPTAASNCIVSFGANGSGNIIQVVLDGSMRPAMEVVGTGDVFATHGTAITSGAWAHVLAVFASATSMVVYLNGVAGTVATTNVGTLSALDRITIGALGSFGNLGSYFSGDIGRVNAWTSALSASDAVALAKGIDPRLIQPGSQVLDLLMNGDASPEQDVRGQRSFTLTNTPAKATTAPRVTRWRRRGRNPLAISTAAAPTNTVAPAVTGTLSTGSTLTCTTGTWTGDPTITYAYQWRRAGVDISGQTASTHVIVEADEAQVITCRVTATNGAGSAGATSNSVTPPDEPVNSVAPAVTGTTVEGDVLTCTQGSWSNSPDTYGYQWQRADISTNISGATSSTYTLQAGDIGHTIRCVVTASNGGGSTSADSNTTATITAPPPTPDALVRVDSDWVPVAMQVRVAGAWVA